MSVVSDIRILFAAAVCLLATLSAYAEEDSKLLFERQPFDRVTLNASANGAVLDVVLLDLPNRNVPNPLPADGSFALRRLAKPSVLYEVSWSSVEKIELFEQLLLQEAEQLTSAKQFVEAYDALAFLRKNYPRLAGLKQATENYLKQDARAAYAAGNFDDSLIILQSLYARNARHRGLAGAVEGIGDRVISKHLSAQRFAEARGVLDLLKKGFPKLSLKSISGWENKFEAGAQRQLTAAREQIEQSEFSAARLAVRRATDIWPTVAGAYELLEEIDRRNPEVVVGVFGLAKDNRFASVLDRQSVQTAELLELRLIELSGVGAAGTIYRSRWGTLEEDDTGRRLQLQLDERAALAGITPDGVVRRLLKAANPARQNYRQTLAALLEQVSLEDGNAVTIQWRRPPMRPESLLQIPITQLALESSARQVYQETPLDGNAPDGRVLRYELSASESNTRQGPRSILERIYQGDDQAVADLVAGNLDVLDQVPPWQIERLSKTKDVVVASFALPTVHVLIPSRDNPLLSRREFRRALCYGIDRQGILHDVLLGGRSRVGFQVLSGPFPAGKSSSDPVGYAYQQQLLPRPYEPRLAAVLAEVARASLSKPAEKGGKSPGELDNQPSAAQEPSEPPALVLAHPPNPVARTACETIRLQLGAIGIPITLFSVSSESQTSRESYDLRYAELALWEPLAEVRPLLGPRGLAGRCTASMGLALEDLDRAGNTKDLIARLKEIHKIAYHDLPVIPLWQTVNHFAHRASLVGIGESPVTLYQNIDHWKTSYQQPRR